MPQVIRECTLYTETMMKKGATSFVEQTNWYDGDISFYGFTADTYATCSHQTVAIFKVIPTTEPLEVRLARRFKVMPGKIVKGGGKTYGQFELMPIECPTLALQDHILHLQNHIS